jgi:hypothetical protein
MKKGHVRNGKCEKEEKKKKLTSEQKTCAHTVVVWKAFVVMMMENNFTLKEGKKKIYSIERKPIIPFRNYNDIVHNGCVEE